MEFYIKFVHTLPTKVHLVKAMVFPAVMYGCESRTVKEAQCKELMLLNCGVGEDSWESHGLQGDPTSPFWRRSTLGFLWKEWCWSWNSSTLPTSWKSWLIGRNSDAGRDWGQEGKETTKDEMSGWHHGLDGRESEWTLGVGGGQGGLVCWDSWGHKESDTTEQLNWSELGIVWTKFFGNLFPKLTRITGQDHTTSPVCWH